MLSKIERRTSNPSIETLLKLWTGALWLGGFTLVGMTGDPSHPWLREVEISKGR
ncbi:MAG: hypothetical protein FJY25_18825 [Betaproteobacteria bacterium]|nr:hypothetical protein [Betaproteobacteria bacterium]